MDYPNLGKFARSAHEFAVYIASNAGSLINYGERFRSGERISSCLAESTVNAVIRKHFAKRQQMQWTKRGAHLLLQTRTCTLDDTLRPLFERWYPGLANDNGNEAVQVARHEHPRHPDGPLLRMSHEPCRYGHIASSRFRPLQPRLKDVSGAAAHLAHVEVSDDGARR